MLAIGRALMARPRLLLLDEPSLGLAPMLVNRIFAVISRLKETGVTILLVEQNARKALGDRRPRLRHGDGPHHSRRRPRASWRPTPRSRRRIWEGDECEGVGWQGGRSRVSRDRAVVEAASFRLPTPDSSTRVMTGAEFGQQFINALSLGSIYALVAIGLAMVFSHPAPDQLRPRRDADDRGRRRRLALADRAALAGLGAARGWRHGARRIAGRAYCLPAAARRPRRDAAAHLPRRLHRPAEWRVAHLRVSAAGVSDA